MNDSTLNSPTRLPNHHLRLTIATAIVDRTKLDDLVEKLWREDPEEVRSLWHAIDDCRISGNWLTSYHRIRENKKKAKLLTRKKFGMTLNTLATRSGIARATLVSLMEHHGLLELAQFGLDQKRRLVTVKAYRAHLGHNVNPVNRIGHLEGLGKAATFPVFYEDCLNDILWMLDYSGLQESVSKQPTKKAKLAYLLGQHPYLPDGEIASLAGYSRRAVITARQNRQLTVVDQAA